MADSDLSLGRSPRVAQRQPPRNARRGYSRFVGLMKMLLPVGALALLAIVVIWPQLQSRENTFSLGFADLSIGNAERLSMINPRYSGLDENKLPYQVTADAANQASAKADDIGLERPKADMTLSDGTWIAIEAPTGNYGQKSQLLDLSGGVNLFHDSGYEFNSPTARVDMAKGTAEGHERTIGHGPFGEIESEGFRLLEKGKTIIFTGKAKLVLYPGGDDEPSAERQP